MSRILSDDYSIEDYNQEEYLSQQAPGLFLLSPMWFRHSNYELVAKKDVLYIRPGKGAKMERYKPFEVFNELLGSFLSMVLEINNLEEEEAESEKDEREYDYKKAETLLSFIKDYGLFGLFWEGIQYSLIDEKNSKIYLTITKGLEDPKNEISIIPLFGPDGRPPQIEYDQYASIYLPDLYAPYPCLEFPLPGRSVKTGISESDFYGNYAEPVKHILWSGTFLLLRGHITTWTSFLKKGYNVNDYYPGPGEYVGFTEKELEKVKKPTWEKMLYLSTQGAAISCSYEKEKGKWGLTWKFRYLLEALSIMYMLNFTGMMGGGVKVCALEGCNKTVLGPHRKYCCKAHGNAHRVRRHRSK